MRAERGAKGVNIEGCRFRVAAGVLVWGLGATVAAIGAVLICPSTVCAVPDIDARLLAQAHALRHPVLNAFFVAITWCGSIYVLLPAALPVAWQRWSIGRKHEAVFLLGSLVGARVLAGLIKQMVDRPRPALFPVLGRLPDDPSFPSAHAMQISAFALGCVLLLGARQRSIAIVLALSLVLLVAYSRVFLQVHYPSDVIAGMVIAACWVIGLRLLLLPRGATSSHAGRSDTPIG